ncbi:MAG TPA: Gfo/Idh/MocA family oxidoreductase [Prolixibacteraceae bacterium]|nr:Gfo/Idh/MocA family oxidoreductase [Prolixibacteraceae bacterium]
MNTFAIIGAAGYVAPKHLEAIKSIQGNVIAVTDPNDNLEVLDRYFPDCEYFKSVTDFEAFIKTKPVDFISICSPTYLHYQHMQKALELGANAICESPLVLQADELEKLIDLENLTGKKVYNILQYRYHPEIIKLKESFNPKQQYNIQLVNHTYRGKWFEQSWKGNIQKSGGILTTLGYHFFDFLIWIYGVPKNISIQTQSEHEAKGTLTLENASIQFSFKTAAEANKFKKERQLIVSGQTYNIDTANTNTFAALYSDIVNNKGVGISQLKKLLELA